MSHQSYDGVIERLFPGAEVTAVTRLTGGVSADVHRIDLRLPGERATSVVLRAHGTSHSGHAAELEYQLLQTLHRRDVPVPEPLLVDASRELLPAPFLIMAFVQGGSQIPAGQESEHIDTMADTLAMIHRLPTVGLPTLPTRMNPLPELFEYLPSGTDWMALRAHLDGLADSEHVEPPRLLHGDFWPENLLWQNGTVAAILDWEDAALGDPLSDVACCRLELRYRYGPASVQRFTQAYARHHAVDVERLALWQVYVAAAAQHFMGAWRLDPTIEAHMRAEALASIREAGAALMGHTAV